MKRVFCLKTKTVKLFLLVVMLCIFLSSCGNQKNKVVVSDLEVIPPELLLEDYDEFWKEFRNNYIFIPILEENGIEIDSIEKKYRETLEKSELDIQGFYSLLEKMLGEMSNFAHLQMVYPGWARFYIDSEYDWLLNETPEKLDVCRATYNKLQELMPDEERAEQINLMRPQVSHYYDTKTVCIRYMTFSYDEGDRDKGLLLDALSNAYDQMGGIDNIIIDIRGNGGGNTEYWRGSIVGPLGGQSGWNVEIFIKDVPLLADTFENSNDEGVFESDFTLSKSYGYKPISEYPKDKTLPPYVEQLGLNYYSDEEETIKDTSEGDIDTDDINKYVLIDGYVYSAADNFAMFCKDTGWATLIGRPTSGDGAGGMPLGVILENTGIIFRFSVTASPNDAGELNTIKGTNPDVFTLKEDALTKCLSIISSEG